MNRESATANQGLIPGANDPLDTERDIEEEAAFLPSSSRRLDAHLQGLSKRQRDCVEWIVWEAMSWLRIEREKGIPNRTRHRWQRDPAMLKAIKEEMKVLRLSDRPQNIHSLRQIRDTSSNGLAVVQAVKALEEIYDDEKAMTPGQSSPGYVIMLPGSVQIGAGQPQGLIAGKAQVIEHNVEMPMQPAKTLHGSAHGLDLPGSDGPIRPLPGERGGDGEEGGGLF